MKLCMFFTVKSMSAKDFPEERFVLEGLHTLDAHGSVEDPDFNEAELDYLIPLARTNKRVLEVLELLSAKHPALMYRLSKEGLCYSFTVNESYALNFLLHPRFKDLRCYLNTSDLIGEIMHRALIDNKVTALYFSSTLDCALNSGNITLADFYERDLKTYFSVVCVNELYKSHPDWFTEEALSKLWDLFRSTLLLLRLTNCLYEPEKVTPEPASLARIKDALFHGIFSATEELPAYSHHVFSFGKAISTIAKMHKVTLDFDSFKLQTPLPVNTTLSYAIYSNPDLFTEAVNCALLDFINRESLPLFLLSWPVEDSNRNNVISENLEKVFYIISLLKKSYLCPRVPALVCHVCRSSNNGIYLEAMIKAGYKLLLSQTETDLLALQFTAHYIAHLHALEHITQQELDKR
jgi:hypothetical protein